MMRAPSAHPNPVANGVVLEICVESIEHAIAAERAGANRIEICCDLSCGGVTPSTEFMQAARRQVRLPIHVLIRPRPGNFHYSDDEFDLMQRDIVAARQIGIDGVVLGILHENTRVDIARTKALVELAHPLPVTFHRAFDDSKDLDAALEDVIQTRAARILTSGGQTRATDALATLSRLKQKSRGRIRLMPCGGINSTNILRVVEATHVREVHSSAGISSPISTNATSSPGGATDDSYWPITRFENEVADMVSLLGGLSLDEPGECGASASRPVEL